MRRSRCRHENALAYARALGTTGSCDQHDPSNRGSHAVYIISVFSTTSSFLALLSSLPPRLFQDQLSTARRSRLYRWTPAAGLTLGCAEQAAPAGMLYRREVLS